MAPNFYWMLLPVGFRFQCFFFCCFLRFLYLYEIHMLLDDRQLRNGHGQKSRRSSHSFFSQFIISDWFLSINKLTSRLKWIVSHSIRYVSFNKINSTDQNSAIFRLLCVNQSFKHMKLWFFLFCLSHNWFWNGGSLILYICFFFLSFNLNFVINR